MKVKSYSHFGHNSNNECGGVFKYENETFHFIEVTNITAMLPNPTENLNDDSISSKSSTRGSSTDTMETATTTYFPFILGEQRNDHGSDELSLNNGSKLCP